MPDMQWSAEVTSTISYTLLKAGFDVNLFYKFTGVRPYYAVNSSQEIVLTEQEGYHMADLTLNKKAFKYLSFNAGIRNLFDVERINSTYAGGSTHGSNG